MSSPSESCSQQVLVTENVTEKKEFIDLGGIKSDGQKELGIFGCFVLFLSVVLKCIWEL